jgi:hypothetical protein
MNYFWNPQLFFNLLNCIFVKDFIVTMKKYWILLIFIITGCSSQFRLDFDQNTNSFKTCSPDITIKNLTIWSGDYKVEFTTIRLEMNSIGSSVVYLCKENPGYSTFDNEIFHFSPNSKYIVTSAYGDSGVEIFLHTDKNAKVDTIINNFKCR